MSDAIGGLMTILMVLLGVVIAVLVALGLAWYAVPVAVLAILVAWLKARRQ